jgi:hypothetical protein
VCPIWEGEFHGVTESQVLLVVHRHRTVLGGTTEREEKKMRGDAKTKN